MRAGASLRLALSETAPALLNTQLLPRRGRDKLLHARDRVCKRHRRLRSMAVAAVPPSPPRYARPYCPPTALVVTPDRHVAKKTAAQGGLGSRRNETGSPRGCLCVGACALDAAMRPLIFAAATLLVSAGAASPQNPQHVTPGESTGTYFTRDDRHGAGRQWHTHKGNHRPGTAL